MRYRFIFLSLLFWAFSLNSQELSFANLPFKKNIKENILQGDIFSESKVNSLNFNKEQSLSFSIAGLHPKSCPYALKTLSLYEEFSHFLNFVKESRYNDSTNEINFLLSHFLLPYEMRLIFKLPRITKVGTYPFSFDVGILKNLNGKIYIMNHGSRCLFYTTASWQGKHTGFSSTIFELFSQTLSRLSMEILFRISSTLSH